MENVGIFSVAMNDPTALDSLRLMEHLLDPRGARWHDRLDDHEWSTTLPTGLRAEALVRLERLGMALDHEERANATIVTLYGTPSCGVAALEATRLEGEGHLYVEDAHSTRRWWLTVGSLPVCCVHGRGFLCLDEDLAASAEWFCRNRLDHG